MAKKKVTPDLIDKAEFEKIVFLGIDYNEIMDYFMVNSAQFWAWVRKAYDTKSPLVVIKKLRVQGKIDFMAKQRKLAEKNPAATIWFGKNYYNQTDEKFEETGNDYEDLNPLIQLLKDDEDGNSND